MAMLEQTKRAIAKLKACGLERSQFKVRVTRRYVPGQKAASGKTYWEYGHLKISHTIPQDERTPELVASLRAAGFYVWTHRNPSCNENMLWIWDRLNPGAINRDERVDWGKCCDITPEDVRQSGTWTPLPSVPQDETETRPEVHLGREPEPEPEGASSLIQVDLDGQTYTVDRGPYGWTAWEPTDGYMSSLHQELTGTLVPGQVMGRVSTRVVPQEMVDALPDGLERYEQIHAYYADLRALEAKIIELAKAQMVNSEPEPEWKPEPAPSSYVDDRLVSPALNKVGVKLAAWGVKATRGELYALEATEGDANLIEAIISPMFSDLDSHMLVSYAEWIARVLGPKSCLLTAMQQHTLEKAIGQWPVAPPANTNAFEARWAVYWAIQYFAYTGEKLRAIGAVRGVITRWPLKAGHDKPMRLKLAKELVDLVWSDLIQVSNTAAIPVAP